MLEVVGELCVASTSVSEIFQVALLVKDLAHRLRRVHLRVNFASHRLRIVNIVVISAILAQGLVDLVFNKLAI